MAAALVRYSRREKAAEAGGWDEVKDAPGAVLHGIGLKVRAPKAAEKKAGAAEKRQPEPTEKKAPEGAKAPAPKKP